MPDQVICLECSRPTVHAHDISPEAYLDMTLAWIGSCLSRSLSLLGKGLTTEPKDA